jgi:hypothetical protein
MKIPMLCVVLGMAASVTLADQLAMIGSTKEGTFQKFENGNFEFLTDKSRFLRPGSSQVTRLVLDKPIRVRYLLSDSNQVAEGELRGFEKRTFNLTRDGQAVAIPLAKVKSIHRVLNNEGNGGNGGYPIPDVNVDDLAKGEVTPQQQAGLNRFTQAKKAFDAFVVESTAMTREMDQAVGARRQALLNKLRERKTAEQPLRNELGAAYKSLTELFPAPANGEK